MLLNKAAPRLCFLLRRLRRRFVSVTSTASPRTLPLLASDVYSAPRGGLGDSSMVLLPGSSRASLCPPTRSFHARRIGAVQLIRTNRFAIEAPTEVVERR